MIAFDISLEEAMAIRNELLDTLPHGKVRSLIDRWDASLKAHIESTKKDTDNGPANL